MKKVDEINWKDPNSKISKNFTVGELCLLRAWKRLSRVDDGLDYEKIIILAEKLEEIRSILKYPLKIHSGFRSVAYNLAQGLKPAKDVHSKNIAADFDCDPKLTIEQIRTTLLPKLEELEIRMEQGTSSWIHIDLRAPGPSGRHFKA